MNKIAYFLFVVVVIVSCATNRPNNAALDKQMTGLLEKKDFFRLETLLNKSGSQLSETKELYFRAHLQNVFNQTEQSLQTIDQLLTKHKNSLNDTLIAKLLETKCDDHIKLFEYKPAEETLHTLLESYSNAVDSADLADLKKDYSLWELLKNAPPQKIRHDKDVTIPVKKNEFDHVTMQVTCGGVSEEFIFDTGANLSTITESYAARMGIQPLEGSVQVGTSTGSDVAMKVGVADSFRIGGLLFENVAFLIIPDEQLFFPEVNYYIHGIIGFPVMYQMKEVRIHKNGDFTIPRIAVKQDIHNLFMDGLTPIVQLESGSDTLLFDLDTGANSSEFSKKYFDSHQQAVSNKGVLKKVKRGGAGGMIETETYLLTDVPFKIGKHEMTIPDISVYTAKSLSDEYLDGTLGQDMTMHFEELILNFEDMYLTFSDKTE